MFFVAHLYRPLLFQIHIYHQFYEQLCRTVVYYVVVYVNRAVVVAPRPHPGEIDSCHKSWTLVAACDCAAPVRTRPNA